MLALLQRRGREENAGASPRIEQTERLGETVMCACVHVWGGDQMAAGVTLAERITEGTERGTVSSEIIWFVSVPETFRKVSKLH